MVKWRRTDNTMVKWRRTDNTMVKLRRTDNTMVKWRRTFYHLMLGHWKGRLPKPPFYIGSAGFYLVWDIVKKLL
jgi:hypothetical protein